METIPNELLSKICSHSHIAASRQLRIVDRTLAQLAAKFLFEEINLILLPETLEKVR